MLGGIKNFIRSKLLTPEHPFFWQLESRRRIAQLEHHSQMSYAEIESAIGNQYRNMFGRPLNWDNPQTYNEKIHVSKVYMPDPIKTRLADKYLVREWITERIGSEYLIPLLGVYDSFDEIDFDTLPNQFVIKCNHDSGSVTLVKDKSKIDRALLRRKYNFLMRRNFAWFGWEMHYRDIQPKIIVEQYMGNAINDYKFLCFNGRAYYCWVDFDRYTNHKRNIYSLDWELQSFNQYHYGNYEGSVKCPDEFEKMKRIADALCKGFGHVRVDLYVVEGHIYFGEMTFTNGNGFEEIIPDEWSYKLGELWPFDNTVRAKVRAKYSRPLDYHP